MYIVQHMQQAMSDRELKFTASYSLLTYRPTLVQLCVGLGGVE